jgi:hypothetical protein
MRTKKKKKKKKKKSQRSAIADEVAAKARAARDEVERKRKEKRANTPGKMARVVKKASSKRVGNPDARPEDVAVTIQGVDANNHNHDSKPPPALIADPGPHAAHLPVSVSIRSNHAESEDAAPADGKQPAAVPTAGAGWQLREPPTPMEAAAAGGGAPPLDVDASVSAQQAKHAPGEKWKRWQQSNDLAAAAADQPVAAAAAAAAASAAASSSSLSLAAGAVPAVNPRVTAKMSARRRLSVMLKATSPQRIITRPSNMGGTAAVAARGSAPGGTATASGSGGGTGDGRNSDASATAASTSATFETVEMPPNREHSETAPPHPAPINPESTDESPDDDETATTT